MTKSSTEIEKCVACGGTVLFTPREGDRPLSVACASCHRDYLFLKWKEDGAGARVRALLFADEKERVGFLLPSEAAIEVGHLGRALEMEFHFERSGLAPGEEMSTLQLYILARLAGTYAARALSVRRYCECGDELVTGAEKQAGQCAPCRLNARLTPGNLADLCEVMDLAEIGGAL